MAGLLLLRQGFALEGHHFLFRPGSEGGQARASAERVARALGIPLVVQDLSEPFQRLRASLVSSYRHGRTPNPCVLCNRIVKTGVLLDRVLARGASGLATGHYARADRRRGRLFQAARPDRDQSYFLSWVPAGRFRRLYFPLGERDKEEVRRIAGEAGWDWLLERGESREICFVSRTYRELLEEDRGRPGEVVDREGRVLGRHQGVGLFTVGQRKGLPPGGRPRYVLSLDPLTGRVVVGDREDLVCRRALAAGVNLFRDLPLGEEVEGLLRIRSTSKGRAGTWRLLPGGRAEIRFREPEWGAAPGQLAVLYRDGEVLASGILRKRLDAGEA